MAKIKGPELLSKGYHTPHSTDVGAMYDPSKWPQKQFISFQLRASHQPHPNRHIRAVLNHRLVNRQAEEIQLNLLGIFLFGIILERKEGSSAEHLEKIV